MKAKFNSSITSIHDLFLIVSLTPSYDNSVRTGGVSTHLVSSSCYVDTSVLLGNLQDSLSNPNWDPEITVVEVYKSSNYLYAEVDRIYKDTNKKKFRYFKVPSFVFFSLRKRHFFELCILNNINSEQSLFSLNRCIFLFKGFSWLTVQLKFRSFKISISGGSTSKRHQLKSVSFYLSKFLLSLDVDISKIYESFKLSKIIEDAMLEDSHRIDIETMLDIMNSMLDNKLNNNYQKLYSLESLVVDTKSLLQSTNQEINRFNIDPTKFARKQEKKSLAIKKDLNLQLNEISLIKSQIDVIKNELNNLEKPNLNYFKIKEIYFNKYHNEHVKNVISQNFL